MSGVWSTKDKWKLVKAGKLYESQWLLIKEIEYEGTDRTYESYAHASRRLRSWVPPTNKDEPKLRIETEPEVVKTLILNILANSPQRRCHLPKILGPIDSPDEDRIRTSAEVVSLERRVQSLTDKLKLEQNKVKAGHRDETVFRRMAKTMEVSIESFRDTPPNPDVQKSSDMTVVHGVALLGDEHGDAIVDSQSVWGLDHYDFNIFRCRMETWSRVIVDYVNTHLPRHKFEHLWIFKLGDGIQGDIHEKSKVGYFQSSLKGALAVGEVEAQALWWIYQKTGVPMTVLSVAGNHPRRSLRKDYEGPHDNFDYLIATQIATRLADTPIKVCVPDAWTAFADVLGYTWAINHGDDVVGYAGFPWYGFDRKNQRIQALVARKGFRIDYFCYGHFHTTAQVPSAGARSFHNGNWYYTDAYAINKLSVGDAPQQNFYILSEKRGVIFEIPIALKEPQLEELVLNGEVEPEFGRDIVLDQVALPGTELVIEGRGGATPKG